MANFGSRYRDRFAESLEATQAFAKVAEVAARIDANAKVRLRAALEGRQVKAAARRAVYTRMQAIVRTARGVSTPGSAVDHGLRMPRGRSGAILRQAAQLFLDEGARVKDRLVRLGLPGTFLDDLRLALAQFTSATTGRHSGRSDVAKARRSMTAALGEGSDALRVLDIVVTNIVGDDPGLFAAWRRDRHVVIPRSARRSRADVPPFLFAAPRHTRRRAAEPQRRCRRLRHHAAHS